ncbi:MAG TPA: HlyD family efflux transporter periplasmic adaptor subunit [Candidatus Paceibacterota bacterium]
MTSSRASALPHTLWHRVKTFATTHLFWSAVIGLVVLYGGYRVYSAFAAPATTPHYLTTTVATGTVVAALTETGQVSASHELNVMPRASGEITWVGVQPGDHVYAGQAIAQLDATDARRALKDAQLSLETAELTYEQDTASSTDLVMLQARNGITNAETSLQKTHDTSYASIASAYTDLSSLISSLDSVLHDENVAMRPTQQNIDAYADIVGTHDNDIGIFRNSAETSYTAAVTAYNKAIAIYKATPRTASDDDLIALAQTTYTATEAVAQATKDAHDFFDRIDTDYTLYNFNKPSTLATQITAVNTDTATVNGDLSAILTTKSNIVSAGQAVAEAKDTLTTATEGPDTLARKSAALALEKAQTAVETARQNLADYTVTAPFTSTVAAVNVKAHDQAGSGTAIATLVTTQQLLDISVNEVDATKLRVGQKATVTFDALPDVTLAGTVSSVDIAGTVSSGVVSYGATLTFDTDNAQVKPGMSATANIITGTQTGLVVPASAVKTAGGESYIEAFDPPLSADLVAQAGAVGVQSSTAPTRVPVTVGLSDDTHAVITSGLSAGDQIIAKTLSDTATTLSNAAKSTSALGGGTMRVGGGGGSNTMFRALGH